MLRFFHEAWDHALRVSMCKMVNKKMLANILVDLTAKTIWRHSPKCEA